jgi:hypothetical protein
MKTVAIYARYSSDLQHERSMKISFESAATVQLGKVGTSTSAIRTTRYQAQI